MDTQSLPLVPFGKYKGQPIITLINDTKYLEWCKQQEWFQNFPIVYNICVNQTITTNNQNSKTPEHNNLQNLFLENENVEKLWSIITNKYSKSRHKILKLSSYKIEFEGKFNWDCIFIFKNYTQCLGDSRCCTDKFNIQESFVFSEIKPLLGDDYPCVLRKIKSQVELTRNAYKNEECKYLLIIKEYNSTTTSKEKLLKIFAQTNIGIVFTNELFDNLQNQILTKSLDQIQDIIQPTQQKYLEDENKLLREKISN